MASELIINVNPQETRAALIENGLVTEIYVERDPHRGYVGNIYKGRVLRVLPGMQAAFVDIGLERSAFLFVSDIDRDSWRTFSLFLAGEEEPDSYQAEQVDQALGGEAGYDYSLQPRIPPHGVPIEEILKEGQEIMVQVTKDPLGTKGPRVTMHASLPGRHLVYMPTVNHIGVSRRIEDEKERERLKSIIEAIRPPNAGFIVRTVSRGKVDKEFKADMDYLLKLWEDIQKRMEEARAPAPLHRDLNLTLRLIRDIFTPEVTRLLVDCPKEYERVLEFAETFMPRLRPSIQLYDGAEPIFDAFRVEVQISEALRRKVWLKSGGYIVIDETEALTAIDVNTGKFVGHRNLDETILKTNLEAVKEICYQLRLRNIGGIIIIDFIDMERKDHRDHAFMALQEALKMDRAQTYILKFSELGLVEMTRKRTRESILRTLGEYCPYCDGKGFTKSSETICYEVLRQIRRECHQLQGKKIVLNLHPDIVNIIYSREHEGIERIERDCGRTILIKTRYDFHKEQFEISSY